MPPGAGEKTIVGAFPRCCYQTLTVSSRGRSVRVTPWELRGHCSLGLCVTRWLFTVKQYESQATGSTACWLRLRWGKSTTASELADALTAGINEGPAALIIRLDLVTFLDSTGVTVLVQVHRRATNRGMCFSLAAPSEPVRKVIALTGIDMVLPVHPTIRAALAEGRAHLAAAASGDQRSPRKNATEVADQASSL